MFRDRDVRRLALARLVSAAGAQGTFFVGIWGRAAFEMTRRHSSSPWSWP